MTSVASRQDLNRDIEVRMAVKQDRSFSRDMHGTKPLT